MADNDLGDNNNNNLNGAGGPDEEDKTEYKMLNDDIKYEINECFDIFDKDKDN